MNKQLHEILSGSIAIEKKLGSHYRNLCALFPEDHGFWCGLADEKDSHSENIRSSRNQFLHERLPDQKFDGEIEHSRRFALQIDTVIEKYKHSPPTTVLALAQALELEMISGEFYLNFSSRLPFNNAVIDLLSYMIAENANYVRRLQEMINRRIK